MKKPLPHTILKNVPLVYFVRSLLASTDGLHPIKIGVSQGLLSRLEGLRGQNAHPVELLGVVVFSNDRRSRLFEKRLHGKFSLLHLHHEWFSGAKGLLAYIRRVSTPVLLPDADGRDFTRAVLLPARVSALGGPADPLLCLDQVAKLLKTSPRMVNDLTAAGFLPVVRVGQTMRRYERRAVVAAIAEWDAIRMNKVFRQKQLQHAQAGRGVFYAGTTLTRQQIDALLEELREDAADAKRIAAVQPEPEKTPR